MEIKSEHLFGYKITAKKNQGVIKNIGKTFIEKITKLTKEFSF